MVGEYHSAILDSFFGSDTHALQQLNAPQPDLDPPSSSNEYTYLTTSAKDDTELLSLETHLESASFETTLQHTRPPPSRLPPQPPRHVPLTPAEVADCIPIAFRELADIAIDTKIMKAFNGKPYEGSVTATTDMDGVYLHVVTYDADGDQETMTWREVERFARAHQAYVSYNTDPTATTPPIPTASSTNATAATAEPEDNTNDYSLRTRKLGSSPVPSEIVRSESEPWQPTTSSAIGLPNPSPPLPPPFLTSATYLCDARGNIIGKPGIPCDAYTNSNRTTIGAPPSPGVKTEVKRYRRVLRSRQ